MLLGWKLCLWNQCVVCVVSMNRVFRLSLCVCFLICFSSLLLCLLWWYFGLIVRQVSLFVLELVIGQSVVQVMISFLCLMMLNCLILCFSILWEWCIRMFCFFSGWISLISLLMFSMFVLCNCLNCFWVIRVLLLVWVNSLLSSVLFLVQLMIWLCLILVWQVCVVVFSSLVWQLLFSCCRCVGICCGCSLWISLLDVFSRFCLVLQRISFFVFRLMVVCMVMFLQVRLKIFLVGEQFSGESKMMLCLLRRWLMFLWLM